VADRRARWPWVVTAVFAAVLATCCGLGVAFRNEIGCHVPLVECLGGGAQLYIRNDRPDDVTIRTATGSFTVRAGELLAVGDLACRGTPVVAIDRNGTELGRLESDPRCDTTRTWIFEPSGIAHVETGRLPTPS